MKNQKGREKREGSQGTKCPESWAPCRPELPEKRQVSKKPQQLRNHANIRGSVTFPAVTQPLDGKLEPRSWRPRGTSSGRTSTECGRRPGRRLGPEPRCREPSEQDVLNSAQGPSAGRLWGWREGHPATGGLVRVTPLGGLLSSRPVPRWSQKEVSHEGLACQSIRPRASGPAACPGRCSGPMTGMRTGSPVLKISGFGLPRRVREADNPGPPAA